MVVKNDAQRLRLGDRVVFDNRQAEPLLNVKL